LATQVNADLTGYGANAKGSVENRSLKTKPMRKSFALENESVAQLENYHSMSRREVIQHILN
jgi:hypothetical protein